jgi:hypothetical protein
MTYKKKLIFLLSLISVLFITYIVSLLLSPEITGSRSSLFTWFDVKYLPGVNRIVINIPGDYWDSQTIELVKKNNRNNQTQWFVLYNDTEYPARSLRIDDFLEILTERASWSIRYTNEASHARLGLDVESASRVTVYDRNNSILLDLLLGEVNNITNEVFLRKFGQNEVRSGNFLIASYIEGSVNSWYNFKLLPENEDGSISVDNVQRLSVYDGDMQLLISRRNREWIISGLEGEMLDQSGIESYIRTLLIIDGDEFIEDILPGDPMFYYGRIVLEMGNGVIRTINLSPPDETNRRYAYVSGSDYIYSIPAWVATRLIRSSEDFVMR